MTYRLLVALSIAAILFFGLVLVALCFSKPGFGRGLALIQVEMFGLLAVLLAGFGYIIIRIDTARGKSAAKRELPAARIILAVAAILAIGYRIIRWMLGP